jgi:hypothetical protein
MLLQMHSPSGARMGNSPGKSSAVPVETGGIQHLGGKGSYPGLGGAQQLQLIHLRHVAE